MLTGHFCVSLCVSWQWWRWRAASRRACRARSEQPASRGQGAETLVSLESCWTDAVSKKTPKNQSIQQRSKHIKWHKSLCSEFGAGRFLGGTCFTRAPFSPLHVRDVLRNGVRVIQRDSSEASQGCHCTASSVFFLLFLFHFLFQGNVWRKTTATVERRKLLSGR